MHRVSATQAFTLVELLVVVSIIALLIALLLPALRKARDTAQLVVCSANQRQVGTAMQFYAMENNQQLPSSKLGLIQGGWATGTGIMGVLVKADHLTWTVNRGSNVMICPADKQTYLESNSDTPNPWVASTYKGIRRIGWVRIWGNPWPAGLDPYPSTNRGFLGLPLSKLVARYYNNGTVRQEPFTYGTYKLAPEQNPPLMVESALPPVWEAGPWIPHGVVRLDANPNESGYELSHPDNGAVWNAETSTPHDNGNRSVLYADNHVETGYVSTFNPSGDPFFVYP
jgi:prepilin-type N-terminal cleavage/methylation domain-containing protein/prepilin-type processing-associated H-X9-DG protein